MRKLLLLILPALFLFSLTSCFLDIDDDAPATSAALQTAGTSGGDMAYIKLSLGENKTSRTVRPAASLLPTTEDLTEWKLIGKKDDGAEQSLAYWANISDLQQARLPLLPGKWQLTLTAKSAGNTEWIGENTVTLSAGVASTIAFTLTPQGGEGDVSVKFSFPSGGGVVAATMSLENLATGAVVVDSAPLTLTEDSSAGKSSVLCEKTALPTGSYILSIKLYADSSKTTLLLAYDTVVVVVGGLESKAELETEYLTGYTLTLDANGGVFADGTTTKTLNVPVTATLPTAYDLDLTKTNDSSALFLFWSDEALSTVCKDGGEVTLDRHTTLKAKWLSPHIYVKNTTDSYELGFVDSNTGASPTRTGLLEEKPLKTVSEAVEQINALVSEYDLGKLDWTITVTGSVSDNATILGLDVLSLNIEGKTGYSSDILDGGAKESVLTISENYPVTITGLTIQNGKVSGGGGLCIDGGGEFTVKNCVIKNNEATVHGGGIYVGSNTSLTLENCTLTGNTALEDSDGDGGALYVNGGTVSLSDCTISNNKVKRYGGGICVESTSTGGILINDTTITENTAIKPDGASDSEHGNGGGIYIKEGSVVLGSGKPVTIEKNTASDYGGGIVNKGTVFFWKGTISSNTSQKNAGGVQNTGGTFTMYGGSISENKASENAGGVSIEGGKFTMSGGTISKNKTTGSSGLGGGVYALSGTLEMSGTATISENTAANGGGVFIRNIAKLTMNGGTISENTATNGGGGVCCAYNGTFEMKGGTISKNSAKYGGGVQVLKNDEYGTTAGTFKMTGGTISANTAEKGGAVRLDRTGTFEMGASAYIPAGDDKKNDVAITSDFSANSGAFIKITSALTATKPVATITPEHYTAGEKVIGADTPNLLLSEYSKFAVADDSDGASWNIFAWGTDGTIWNGSFDYYVKETGSDNFGVMGTKEQPFRTLSHAIEVINALNTFNIPGADNFSYTIHIIGNVTVPTDKNRISDIKAKSLTIKGETGTDTDALDGNGSVCVLELTNNVPVTIKNLTIKGGKNDKGAGIIKTGSETLTLSGVSITGCEATGNGGALYIQQGEVILEEETYIGKATAQAATATSYSNTAAKGGGIYVASGGTLTLSETLTGGVNGNYATDRGGGIYSEQGSTVIVERGNISFNGTYACGGGINGDGSVTVSGGTIQGNGGRGIYSSKGEIDLSGSALISENKGGIYIGENAQLSIGGSAQITKNTASAGAGVQSNGTFKMTGGTISENTTSGNGGGVHVKSGTFSMSGGTISANTATGNGGGVFNEGTMFMSGSAVVGDSSKNETATSSAYSNTAAKGGGIYSTGTVYLGYSDENTKSSLTGGVYYNYSGDVGGIAQEGGESFMNSGNISYNDGRGLYLYNCTFTMSGGKIRKNTSSGIGGGVYAGWKGAFKMNGGEITENNSGADGGGVSIGNTGSSFTMTGGTISENTASGNGGGVFLENNTFTMSGGQISGNKGNGTNSRGGGVYLKEGTFKMGGGTISGNYATGSGGGVCIEAGGKFFMYGASVIGDASKRTEASSSAYSNYTKTSGGGIYANNNSAIYLGYSDETTEAELTGGIYYNYSASTVVGGGGINTGEELNMASGTIAYNSANNRGGGLYIQSNSKPVTISGGSITGNSSGTGGAIYLYSGTFTMSGTASIPAGSGGKNDVYLASGKTITVGGTLSESTAATITPSSYTAGTQVLSGTQALLANEHDKFAVTNDADGKKWVIDSAGRLQRDGFTVTFNSNTGSEVSSQIVPNGSAATKPTNPTKEGWVFDGWATSPNASKVYGGETYDFTAAVTANITLYARWRKPINLVKDLMGATSQAAGVIVYYGGTYGSLYGSDVIPTITGSWATFKGWYTEEDGQGTKITETMTVGDDVPSSVYGNWELSYSTGNIGDIVLQTGKYVTAENYKNGRDSYNAQNGGTRASSLKEFSSTAVGVVCASGYMVHLSVISDSAVLYTSASDNAKKATASGFESDWTLPNENTMQSIHLNRDTINASLNVANSTSKDYILEQSYWISTKNDYVTSDGTKLSISFNPNHYYCAVHALP